ncbi:MAG: DUF4266 domain-containing protein [Gammaproteobacteria bacterium]|nr:DUF4266 domain-containing protein [Gammaproteobacteria bacterium]
MRRMILLALLAVTASACSEVKPWDRDLLADPAMQLVPSPIDSALDEHIFFSKEASSGGQGVGGGGCGCN